MFLPLFLLLCWSSPAFSTPFPDNASTKTWYPHYEGGSGKNTYADIHILDAPIKKSLLTLLKADEAFVICRVGTTIQDTVDIEGCDAFQNKETVQNDSNEFLLTERCIEHGNCPQAIEYVKNTKPVFNLEYENDHRNIQETCRKSAQMGFNTVIKYATDLETPSMIQCSSPLVYGLNQMLAQLEPVRQERIKREKERIKREEERIKREEQALEKKRQLQQQALENTEQSQTEQPSEHAEKSQTVQHEPSEHAEQLQTVQLDLSEEAGTSRSIPRRNGQPRAI